MCRGSFISNQMSNDATGLADALVMLGLRYGSRQSLTVAADVMRLICYAAYRASIEIARERGSFPYFERDPYLQGPFIRGLPDDIQTGIATHGIRNSHLLAIAPTGTISLLAGNVSSGLEPIFAASYRRKVLDENGVPQEFLLTDHALARWRAVASAESLLPNSFVTVAELGVVDHLDMQAALQPFVDNSISKTINVSESRTFDDFKRINVLAYDKGLPSKSAQTSTAECCRTSRSRFAVSTM